MSIHIVTLAPYYSWCFMSSLLHVRYWLNVRCLMNNRRVVSTLHFLYRCSLIFPTSCSSVSHALCHFLVSVCFMPPLSSFSMATGGYTSSCRPSWSILSPSSIRLPERRFHCNRTTI